MHASEVEVPLPSTPERLSWSAICQRYPDRWVVLANIDPERGSPPYAHETVFFDGADVIAVFERRKDASPTVRALLARDHVSACFWTGQVRGSFPRFTP